LTLLLALVASSDPLQGNASEDAILKQLLPAFSSIGATHLLTLLLALVASCYPLQV
jgi:hypothetical protein